MASKKLKTKVCKAYTNDFKRCNKTFTVFGKSKKKYCSDACRKRHERKRKERARKKQEANVKKIQKRNEEINSNTGRLKRYHLEINGLLYELSKYENIDKEIPEDKGINEFENVQQWTYYNSRRNEIIKEKEYLKSVKSIEVPHLSNQLNKLLKNVVSLCNESDNLNNIEFKKGIVLLKKMLKEKDSLKYSPIRIDSAGFVDSHEIEDYSEISNIFK